MEEEKEEKNFQKYGIEKIEEKINKFKQDIISLAKDRIFQSYLIDKHVTSENFISRECFKRMNIAGNDKAFIDMYISAVIQTLKTESESIHYFFCTKENKKEIINKCKNLNNCWIVIKNIKVLSKKDRNFLINNLCYHQDNVHFFTDDENTSLEIIQPELMVYNLLKELDDDKSPITEFKTYRENNCMRGDRVLGLCCKLDFSKNNKEEVK